MSIQLKQPYKIIQHKQKRYQEHYHIPSDKCVVVPIKEYGEDFSCDVQWRDGDGNLHEQHDLFFSGKSIEPIDQMKDYLLHEVFSALQKES